MGRWQVYIINHEFTPSAVKSNLKTIGYPHNIYATIRPVGTCGLAGGYYDIQHLLLSETTDDFPPVVYISPSSTRKANQTPGKKLSWSVPVYFLSVLESKYVESLAIGS